MKFLIFRQFQFRMGRENFCSIHVSLVPQPSATGEHKTKPTQVRVIQVFLMLGFKFAEKERIFANIRNVDYNKRFVFIGKRERTSWVRNFSGHHRLPE